MMDEFEIDEPIVIEDQREYHGAQAEDDVPFHIPRD
jgi:hypothetical protein